MAVQREREAGGGVCAETECIKSHLSTSMEKDGEESGRLDKLHRIDSIKFWSFAKQALRRGSMTRRFA
jgi:hypothetical protein